MEKYLNPDNIGDYNKKEFWEKAFSHYKNNYDWYGSFNDFKNYFTKYIKKTDSILLVGCGNSSLGEKLYDNGYHSVTCIDYSETVINNMKQRKGKRSTLVYSVMDATKMTYENECFDVVIDKACLDAIYAENDDKCKKDATLYMSEVLRVLKQDGIFFTISMSQNYITQFIYDTIQSYDSSVFFIGDPQNAHLTNPLFLYITKNHSSSNGMTLNFNPSHGFFPSHVIVDRSFGDITSGDALVNYMNETRYYFMGHNILREIHKSENKSIFTIPLFLKNKSGNIHAYTFTIWDHPSSEKQLSVTSVLVVPSTNETLSTYHSCESIFQFIESVKCDRMIVVFRNQKNSTEDDWNDEELKADCSSLFHYFLPIGSSTDIAIYSPPKSEISTEVTSGILASGSHYVVVDRAIDDKQYSRQLIFMSNMKAVQSELYYHYSGGKKKKRVYEMNRLSFDIHRVMAASLLLCPPLSQSPSILILGLGGGCLPSFFQFYYPKAVITAVDIDEEVIRIAKEYFRLNPSIQTVNADALTFIKEQEGKSTYDYIFVDIDAKDPKSSSSFPPMNFLTKDCLNVLKRLQNDTGVVVYNISSFNGNFLKMCEMQFRKLFKNVRVEKTEDVNVAFIASDRMILNPKEVNENRTETNQNYMKDYSFRFYYCLLLTNNITSSLIQLQLNLLTGNSHTNKVLSIQD